MKLGLISFTARGEQLANRLAAALGGQAFRCKGDISLADFAARGFSDFQGLIFVGATGIALRAIAPHISSKVTDPAVVVVDEGGTFAISLLSGHLGGGNDLTRQVAQAIGATPVITTATDVSGVFAADSWAKHQGMTVANPSQIVTVSSKLLDGGTVRLGSAFLISGTPPQGVLLVDAPPYDVYVGVDSPAAGLWLVPSALTLGVGCRRGTSHAALEASFSALCAESNLHPATFCGAASIDLKAEEAGLLSFCGAHGWALSTYSAQTLNGVAGQFTPSAFVAETTGVDNVCERSCVCASGGTLTLPKRAGNGITMAVATAPLTLDWSITNG